MEASRGPRARSEVTDLTLQCLLYLYLDMLTHKYMGWLIIAAILFLSRRFTRAGVLGALTTAGGRKEKDQLSRNVFNFK